MMRILIADDHAVVRKGLAQILLDGFPGARIEEVENSETLIKAAIKGSWDVIISDLTMPGRSGLDALRQLKELFPKLPILIMSMHSEDQYAIRALKAGASGYISKETAPEELVKAVRLVLNGKKYITPSTAEKLADTVHADTGKPPHELLSDRELHVLQLLAGGKAVSEIAGMLSLSNTTVSTYRSRIMHKMGMKSNAELTMYAMKNSLL
ncbi:MAG: response regulator transcription factor [Bacteroidota bacterium]|nr:response regulator transcription factor [Bacteroidota bacterium]MDP4217651.1 response regulator transcription factor [Bacteroidota bacterium]MDP4245569.1 response regulator transcription factor [Bacteroidota bacterium]MDP4255757.1 response regulator transcription factor [Bacteroidota bacterium]MDP4257338.1 response regulator transcription factor [Bacteroidota bacterium]